VFAVTVLATVLARPIDAFAATTCGVSSGHTLCVTVGASTLSGNQLVTITNVPNNGPVFTTWNPPGAGVYLMEQDVPSPATGDYSFTWPTTKYLDATGSLAVTWGDTTAVPVTLAGIRLSNGNTTSIQHTASDWQSYLPGTWTQPTDATILAVGDGPSDEPTSNVVANQVLAAAPPLFLFLGDIYEEGSYTENLNHYGVSSLDVPGGGTLWGATANVTQPTIGNHEFPHIADWTDYWHQRPQSTAFTFGGVLFIDLNSSASFAVGSPQYVFVQSVLASAPPCVVAYWHIPVFKNSTIDQTRLPMWSLLADNGGDLVLTGHLHTMSQYIPLDDQGQPGGHMVQLIAGSGGHSLGGTQVGTRVAWSRGKTAGVVSLALNGSANGGSASSLAWTFKNTAGNALQDGSMGCGVSSPGPTITSFSPTSGPVGTPVTINGTGFTGASDVRFNNLTVGAGNFTVNSDIKITATVPAGASTGLITVVGLGGPANSATAFTVSTGPVPTITSFTPTSGPAGTIVTILGTNFTSSAVVKFNGATGTGFVFKSATKVKANVPATATTGPISVTTAAGTATSATNFTVPSGGSTPTITSFSPTSGPVGTSVTINGTNFTGATVVKFNGVIVATFTVNSDIKITATVPAGATTGKIIVKTPAGNATSLTKFTVT
jgi:hypothetical protein